MGHRFGFTVVELLTVIVVIGILAAISILGYGSWQHGLADKAVQHDLLEASSSLERYLNQQNYYPSNLAGTKFAASPNVALRFMTNSQQTPQYQNLTPDQNAQLLLNSCNAYMPVISGNTTYNTACAFAGNNFHVKGEQSSNVILNGPTIQQQDFTLTCGGPCNTAQANILQIFQQQGGTWPVIIPKKQVPLPDPLYIPIEDTGTKYCLEGMAVSYGDIVYHTSPTNKLPAAGPCPADPDLHYP